MTRHSSVLTVEIDTSPAGTAQAEAPRTLAALVEAERAAGAEVHELAADAETLGMLLPIFGKASATTTGPHALLSERGGYGPVRLAGQRYQPLRNRIALRLTSGRGERVVMTAADAKRRKPAGLHLFAADGQLCHRIEIAAPQDLLLLAGLHRDLGDGPVDMVPDQPGSPVPDPASPHGSIPQIRRLQAEWHGMDEAAHLDDLLLTGGVSRAQCLRFLAEDGARPVLPGRIAPFLKHLAEERVAFRRSVLRPGCLQSCGGIAEFVSTGSDLVLMRSRTSLFALDRSAVACCWLTRWTMGGERRSVIELYDRSGLCLALLADRARTAKEADLWERLVRMLAAS